MNTDPNQSPQPSYQQPAEQWSPPSLPPTYNELPPTQYIPPANEQAPPVPPPAQQSWRPAPRGSRRGIWIALAIVGVVLVLGCGACLAAAIAGVGFFAKTISGPSTAANAYYQALKGQDYPQAFSYIDASGISSQQGQQVTQEAFSILAQEVDTASGKIVRFSQTNVSVNGTNGASIALVTMSVTRSIKGTYTVQLQLKEENGVWKITDFTGI